MAQTTLEATAAATAINLTFKTRVLQPIPPIRPQAAPPRNIVGQARIPLLTSLQARQLGAQTIPTLRLRAMP